MRYGVFVTLVAAACVSIAAAPVDTRVVQNDAVSSPETPHVASAVQDARREFFQDCGVLARGPQTCTIFHADDGEAYAIANLGEFFPGDYVFVSGWIDENSLACWPASIPALENNTISACFEGFGTLERGPQNCIVQFVADDGQAYVLDDYGDWWWGDRVYVTGRVNHDSLACWPAVTPTIDDNSIHAVLEGCGTLERGPQNCIVRFIADEGGAYVLDDIGEFWWGDRVYVAGVVTENSWACWPALTPTIGMNLIEACSE